MSNNSIYEKIEEKGRLETEAIKKIGKQKRDEARKRIIDETSDICKQLQKEATNKCNDLLKTSITQFSQQAKQEVLILKKQLINQAFLETLEKLDNISDDDLKHVVIKLLNQDDISGNEVLFVNKKDYDRYKKLFSKNNDDLGLLNEQLSNKVNNAHLTLSKESVDIKGGFILKGTAFDIDNSFETVLKELEERLEANIATILFESEV